jgi:hypothetical protein
MIHAAQAIYRLLVLQQHTNWDGLLECLASRHPGSLIAVLVSPKELQAFTTRLYFPLSMGLSTLPGLSAWPTAQGAAYCPPREASRPGQRIVITLAASQYNRGAHVQTFNRTRQHPGSNPSFSLFTAETELRGGGQPEPVLMDVAPTGGREGE